MSCASSQGFGVLCWNNEHGFRRYHIMCIEEYMKEAVYLYMMYTQDDIDIHMYRLCIYIGHNYIV